MTATASHALRLSTAIAVSIFALTATVAHAREAGQRIITKQERTLPKLYTLNLGKPWQDVSAYFPSTINLAVKSRRPKLCGTDTFFTIQTDFLNDMPRGTMEEFFTRVPATHVTTLVRRMFYPGGEVIEKVAPVKEAFANTEAYIGQYNVRFSNGKRYAMRQYMTYASGYMVHISAYAKPEDRDRAATCFADIFEKLAFIEVPN